jgi:uncharacterized protein
VRQMEVIGVRVEMPSNSPIVLLKEAQGDRYLPIWIGAVEATAIAFAQQGMVSLRPLTHDLFRDVLEVLNIQLRTVNITALRDGIFYADLVFSNGAEVSARPSDSIALALRTGAQIFARKTKSRSSANSSTRSHPRTSAGRPEVLSPRPAAPPPRPYPGCYLRSSVIRTGMCICCRECHDAPPVVVDAATRGGLRFEYRG